MSSSNEDYIDRHFSNDSNVEISGNHRGYTGFWFPGTVLRLKKASSEAVVEYETVRRPLREKVKLVELRPAQPTRERHEYAINDCVDAYYKHGWCEGVITKFSAELNKYGVFIKDTREMLMFGVHRLRPHHEWVYGTWHPELDIHIEDVSSRAPEIPEVPTKTESTPNQEQPERGFEPGQQVEVRNDDENYEGKWFPATFFQTLNENEYHIEFKYFVRHAQETRLIEMVVDDQILRPCPPEVISIDRYNIFENVDAFYDGCWRAGVISKVLNDDEYVVFFGTTGEEIKFNQSQLRVHQKWTNGRWVIH